MRYRQNNIPDLGFFRRLNGYILKNVRDSIFLNGEVSGHLSNRRHFLMSTSVAAPVRWAQRKENVLVTIGVIDVHDPVLKIEGNKFTFSGRAGETTYAADIELFSDIDETASRFVVRPRGIEVILAKKDTKVWWPRLLKATGKFHWVTVDWSRWVDSSGDEPSKPDFNWNPDEGGNFGEDENDSSSSDDEAPGDGETDAATAEVPEAAEGDPPAENAAPPEPDAQVAD
jgi:hypothetical protein